MTSSGRQFVTYLRGYCSMTSSSRHYLSYDQLVQAMFKDALVIGKTFTKQPVFKIKHQMDLKIYLTKKYLDFNEVFDKLNC